MNQITVLIPAYNAEKTIIETLDSLSKQTIKDFDVLVIDDASTDETRAIALAYKNRLSISVISNTVNLGVANSLNLGISNIQSKYIARLDADDIALPTRLEKQLIFMELNTDISVCSTWMEMFWNEQDSETSILAKPVHDSEIKTALVQYCSISHPSIMIRKSYYDEVGNYDAKLDFAEDYDLWCRGALLGKKFANIPEVLTRYRQHQNQVSKTKRNLQHERDLTIKRQYISSLIGSENTGHLAEFFSLLTTFVNMNVAIEVISGSFGILSELRASISNQNYFDKMVSESIKRHLRNI